ncbi:act minimal PKS acyl carrier protein [Lentzea atacamensis]|uniref:Act minimal PKS acyl carrier protein n=1 Tax=Lentzea atacamensis TaxID=531938 RepID=A0ABX9EFC0_9PSEU|nr:acyl carrier protein [Lentzea atacamensis]RAS67442.1 act minimal PKS acyl carrier protein [Lentzea atacamensis]
MSVDTKINLTDLEGFLNASTGLDPITLDESMMDTDFDDLGVDSLALVELVDRMQEAYHLSIDDDTAQDLRTPRMMLDYVNARLENWEL